MQTPVRSWIKGLEFSGEGWCRDEYLGDISTQVVFREHRMEWDHPANECQWRSSKSEPWDSLMLGFGKMRRNRLRETEKKTAVKEETIWGWLGDQAAEVFQGEDVLSQGLSDLGTGKWPLYFYIPVVDSFSCSGVFGFKSWLEQIQERMTGKRLFKTLFE